MKSVLDELLEVGFLTGSRAFGTNRDDSDWDIIYPIYEGALIATILEGKERKPSDYFAGYCIQDGGYTINLIPLHPHEIIPWVLATLSLKSTLKLSGITNRIQIHSIFMGTVCLFKGTVEQRGTLNEYAKAIQDVRIKLFPLTA